MSDRKDDVRQRSPQEFKKLVQLAIRDQQASDPLAVEKPTPVVRPEVDPAVYDAPMFMPALAWNKKGEIVIATTGKKPPPRGDRDIDVSRLAGISASAAAKLREAGFYTAGDMLDRPQPLAGILGVSKMQVKKLLEGARSGALKKATRKPVKSTVARKKATKKATKKKAKKKTTRKKTTK